jgi:hypothetical protein
VRGHVLEQLPDRAQLERLEGPRRSNAPGPPDELWFRELTDKTPTARGLPVRARPDHRDPVTAVEAYLDTHDNDPRPFTWTATAEEILAKSRQRVGRPSCGYPTLRRTIGCVDDGSPVLGAL